MKTNEIKNKTGHLSWIDLLSIIGVFVAANFIAWSVNWVISGMTELSASFSTFLTYVIAMGLTLAFALWLRIRRGVEGPVLHFGLRKTNPGLILWGIVLVLITSVVVEPLINIFPSEYLENLSAGIGRGGWAMLSTIVMAPLLEEMLFRGVIQQSFTQRYGGIGGVLTAAAVFGLIHIIPQQVVNAFFVGIILGYIYIKTGSLIPVIIIHALNNAIAYAQMSILGNEQLSVREMIGNDTVYWIVYGVCVAIFIAAGFNLWSQIKRVQARAETEGNG